MRLDIAGPPHRNPDGVEMACPHLHVYREGYGDKWAVALLTNRYPERGNLFEMLQAFMTDCNIT